MRPLTPLILILFIFFLLSCDLSGGGEISPDLPVIKVLSPSAISETEFQINWSISSNVGFQSISVKLALDKEMAKIINFFQIDDVTRLNFLVSNLQGATQYYYRISLMNNGIVVTESEIMGAETSYRVDNFDLITEDSYTLTSKLAYLESVSGSRPGIIMMHELGVWVNPWVGSELMKQLVSDGYLCLTFFFRGHGTSTPVDDIMDLVNDKSPLVNDLQAAIDFMNGNEHVSQGNLGLIGASLGAIMSLAGNGYDEVKTSVSLSTASDGVFVIFPDMTLSSVYYLVGELDIHDDIGADFPADASTLYGLTEEPRKLDI